MVPPVPQTASGCTAATDHCKHVVEPAPLVYRLPLMSSQQDGKRVRIASIDIVRGLVMVLMALDHVRVYSGVPAGGPTAGIFFTRWITHFCAPAFVFFAGTSAFLHGERLNDRRELSKWLVVRGAWLVLLELTFLRLAWTFNVDFSHYMLAGVIWMLGWCMILLAGLIRLPTPAIAAFGLVVIFAQNVVGLLAIAIPQSLRDSCGWIWQFLYFGGDVNLGHDGPGISVLYSIVPWIGVMAAGYAFGAIVIREPTERRRLCIRIGLSAIALFVAVRGLEFYFDPGHLSDTAFGAAPALLRFLNTRKYPAEQLFLLMTLGPAIAALPLLEGARGWIARWLTVFGRVPLFFYLLHIPFIHLAAVAISLVRSPSATGWLFHNHPMNPGPAPEGYVWNLGLLYLVTAAVVVTLYFPCRWYAKLKARRKDAWLSYL